MESRCLDAVKVVRKVYVRHPNYGDLVRGIDAGGLDGLGDRVPVSVGTYYVLDQTDGQAYHSHPCWEV